MVCGIVNGVVRFWLLACWRIRRRCTTLLCALSAPVTPGRPWACRPTGTKRRHIVREFVFEPRKVLAEFGIDVPDDVEVRVWDSNAEIRYMVLPMRPAGTEDWSEERTRRSRHPRRDDRDRGAEGQDLRRARGQNEWDP